MRRQLFKNGLILTGLVLLTGLNPVVLAKDGNIEMKARLETEPERQKVELEAKRERLAAAKEQRLDERKLKACQKAEANIERHTKNFVASAERQLKVFDGISQKVQKFAVDKSITVADKEAALADIAAAKAQVVSDLDTLKVDAAAFKCDSDNPKGQLSSFQAGAKLVRADLKAYRESVRKLIQAVRQANGGQQ